MLKILQARLQQYVNNELPEVQAGFRKGRGTRDQIANICWIIEKAKEGSALGGPRICLLLQQCLDGTDPGTPLAPASDYPPTFFPVKTYRVSNSAVRDHRDQPPFLNSLLPTNHELPDSSELFHRPG